MSLGQVAAGGPTEIALAADAATDAFDGWVSLPGGERKKILHRIADLIVERADEIAVIESVDTGQPIRFMSSAAIRGAENFRYFADAAPAALDGDAMPTSTHLNYSTRRAIGPVGVITPWNTPFMLSTWKIAPALASGCTVVHKPAEWSPLTASILAEIAGEAGRPAGVLNVVHGVGEVAGKALPEHPAIKAIAFVGESSTGSLIQAQGAPTLKRLHFELGGKNPVVVFDDADLERALDAVVFMIYSLNGERCTRACGFCLVDTRRPEATDPGEPVRVAEAVAEMGLAHAVVTAVARDDLPDGGAAEFVATIRAIRAVNPGTAVEVLISDCKGDPDSLGVVFDARPDVLNHNLETVARLQRTVRPSASYARSLSVLARAGAAGLTTKSALIVGLGETDAEVDGALADLAGVGCDIVTIGQYLRPTTNHLPVERWVEPATFDRWREVGERLGIPHVESGPLVRSSYHARQAAEAATGVAVLLSGSACRPPRRLPPCSCRSVPTSPGCAATRRCRSSA